MTILQSHHRLARLLYRARKPVVLPSWMPLPLLGLRILEQGEYYECRACNSRVPVGGIDAEGLVKSALSLVRQDLSAVGGKK